MVSHSLDAGKFKEAFEKYQSSTSEANTSTDTVEATENKKEEDAITEKLDQLTVKESAAEKSLTEDLKTTTDSSKKIDSSSQGTEVASDKTSD